MLAVEGPVNCRLEAQFNMIVSLLFSGMLLFALVFAVICNNHFGGMVLHFMTIVAIDSCICFANGQYSSPRENIVMGFWFDLVKMRVLQLRSNTGCMQGNGYADHAVFVESIERRMVC